jgi:hypothetical protein
MHIDYDNLVLETESDVEQKLIMPLLTGPAYLNIPANKIFTKRYLAPSVLDKKANRNGGYYPDYAVFLRSFPVLIVEAKAPDVPVEVGYREASLYARQLNQSYPPDVNPCRFLISTNGTDLLFGIWDANPIFSLLVRNLRVGSNDLESLQRHCNADQLEAHAIACLRRTRSQNFVSPYELAGGAALLNAKLPVNEFAAELSPILRRYFSPSSQESNREIYERAYVSSSEITEYDRVLEALLKDRLSAQRGTIVQQLEPGRYGEENVDRVISDFSRDRPSTGQLQIVQGAVGSGKSLFMRRYKELLQPEPLVTRTRWAFVDFNSSPADLAHAESWLCSTFVESFQSENPTIDLASREVLRGIFSRNIQKRKVAYEEIGRASKEQEAITRAEDLMAWQDNPEESARGIADYVLGNRQEVLVTVMDNVDRLDLANQLHAFQLTLWFMQRTKCFVVLQMRDETYERYKDRPPLDTFRTGITFHITPPRFVDVVKRRLELSLEYLQKSMGEEQSYAIETGLRITYKKSALEKFLKHLYADIFDRTRNISRILEALAGRNIRRALDMFVSIITSGHLSETAITSTVLSGGGISISEHDILKILMRTEYRLASDHSGFVFNVLNCRPEWQKPDNFMLIDILYLLAVNRKRTGQIGLEGYFTCRFVADELQLRGYVPEDVLDGLNMLLRSELIAADHMNFSSVGYDDSVKILASGFMHVRILVGRIEYLYGIIPTTPIFDQNIARQLAEHVRVEMARGRTNVHQRVRAVEKLHAYLVQQQRRQVAPFSGSDDTGASYVLKHIEGALNHFRNVNDTVDAPDLLDM